MKENRNITLHLYGRCGSLFFHSLYSECPETYVVPGLAITEVIKLFLKSKKQLPFSLVVDHFIHNLFLPIYVKDCGLDNLGKNSKNINDLLPPYHLKEKILASFDPHIAVGLNTAIDMIHKGCFPDQKKNINFIQLHEIYPIVGDYAVEFLKPQKKVLLIRNPLENVESIINFGLSRPNLLRSLSKTYKSLIGMAIVCRIPKFLTNSTVIELETFKKSAAYRDWASGAIGISNSEESSYFGFDYIGPPSTKSNVSRGFQNQSRKSDAYRCDETDASMVNRLMHPIACYSSYEMKFDTNKIKPDLMSFEKKFISYLNPEEALIANNIAREFRDDANKVIDDFSINRINLKKLVESNSKATCS